MTLKRDKSYLMLLELSNYHPSENSVFWENFHLKSDGEREISVTISKIKEEKELQHGTKRESSKLTKSENHSTLKKSTKLKLS